MYAIMKNGEYVETHYELDEYGDFVVKDEKDGSYFTSDLRKAQKYGAGSKERAVSDARRYGHKFGAGYTVVKV